MAYVCTGQKKQKNVRNTILAHAVAWRDIALHWKSTEDMENRAVVVGAALRRAKGDSAKRPLLNSSWKYWQPSWIKKLGRSRGFRPLCGQGRKGIRAHGWITLLHQHIVYVPLLATLVVLGVVLESKGGGRKEGRIANENYLEARRCNTYQGYDNLFTSYDYKALNGQAEMYKWIDGKLPQCVPPPTSGLTMYIWKCCSANAWKKINKFSLNKNMSVIETLWRAQPLQQA